MGVLVATGIGVLVAVGTAGAVGTGVLVAGGATVAVGCGVLTAGGVAVGAGAPAYGKAPRSTPLVPAPIAGEPDWRW